MIYNLLGILKKYKSWLEWLQPWTDSSLNTQIDVVHFSNSCTSGKGLNVIRNVPPFFNSWRVIFLGHPLCLDPKRKKSFLPTLHGLSCSQSGIGEGRKWTTTASLLCEQIVSWSWSSLLAFGENHLGKGACYAKTPPLLPSPYHYGFNSTPFAVVAMKSWLYRENCQVEDNLGGV